MLALPTYLLAVTLFAANDPAAEIKQLLAQLKDRDAGRRLVAVIKLSERPEAARVSIPGLLAALEDENESVRGRAVGSVLTLDQSRCKEPLDALRRFFRAKDMAAADAAFASCLDVEPVHPDLVAGLLALLREKHPLAEPTVEVMLAQIGPRAKEAVPILEASLKDDHPLVRLYAAVALARVDPRKGAAMLPHIRQGLGSKHVLTGLHAATALARLAPAEWKDVANAMERFLKAPADGDGRVGDFGVEWRYRRRARSAAAALASGLRSREAQVRRRTAQVLALFGPAAEGEERDLRKLLTDADTGVAAAAAEALFQTVAVPHSEVLRSVIAARDARDDTRIVDVVELIATLRKLEATQGDADAGLKGLIAEAADAKKADRHREMRLLYALAQLGEVKPTLWWDKPEIAREAVAMLRGCLDDSSPLVVTAALHGLRWSIDPKRDRELVRELIRRTKDEKIPYGLRLRTLQTLEAIDAEEGNKGTDR